MLIKFVIFSLILCYSNHITKAEKAEHNVNTEVDLVINGLRADAWSEDEHQCLNDTLTALNNVKNSTTWAVWIWNSMHHPTGSFYGSRYSLGNYDQCLRYAKVSNGITTQYCLADLKITEDDGTDGVYTSRKIDFDKDVKEYFNNPNFYDVTDKFMASRMKMGRPINIITWGVCLPSSCDTSALAKIVKSMYKANPITSGDPVITIDTCRIAGHEEKYDTKFYAFMSLVTALAVIAMLSTVYNNYITSDSILTNVSKSFDIKHNWNSFVKTSPDDIPVINFTKTFHIVFTTFVHVIIFNLQGPLSNALDVDTAPGIKDTMLGNFFSHCDLLSIENFTLISGILHIYGLLKKKRNLIICVIQRYIRLVASFSIIIFYTIAVAKYTGSGPIWDKMIGREVEACSENWLVSLSMLNNYIDAENICVIVAWYIPYDFHLTLIGTILFYVYQRNNKVGTVTIILCYIANLMGIAIYTYKEKLPGIVMYNIQSMVDPRQNIYYLNTHIKSHLRTSTYILGMAMAYILVTRQPAKYRGIISKKLSYPILVGAFVLALKAMTDAPAWCLGDYDAFNTAVYVALNTQVWSIATLICIGVNEYGDLPALRRLMSWPGFTYISRLGYGIYLTHSLILQRGIFLQRGPRYFDSLDMLIYVIGVFVVSSVLSVLLWLFVEAPLCNLTNLILLPKRNHTNSSTRNKNVNRKLKEY